MELTLKESDEIWTKDGEHLGQAHRLYHRSEGIDPDLQLYASYLYVVSFGSGDDYYVPTDFIDGREDDTDRVILTVPMQEVLDQTWSREPDFIARGKAVTEALPNE